MDRIGVVGVDWQHHGMNDVARFTIPPPERSRRLPALAKAIDAAELAYVATCNRVDVIFATPPGQTVVPFRRRIFEALEGRAPEPGEAERVFRAWAGEGAAEHLFLVAAGIDSARVGETEIASQIRSAMDSSRALELLGPRLDLVLEEALRIARRVHGTTELNHGRTSLAEIALDHVRRRLRRVRAPVALVGVSAMTLRCARELAAEGVAIVIVNRTRSRAEDLAREVGGEALSLAEFRGEPPAVAAVILATSADGPVLDRGALERLAAHAPHDGEVVLIDLAVPHDVDPATAHAVGLPRIGMTEVNAEASENRTRRIHDLAEARVLIDEQLPKLRRRLADRMLAPLMGALQRRYRDSAREGIERLLRDPAFEWDPRHRVRLEKWVETLARRLAHIPTVGLRSLGRREGIHAVHAFLADLDDRSGGELRRCLERRPSLSLLEEERHP